MVPHTTSALFFLMDPWTHRRPLWFAYGPMFARRRGLVIAPGLLPRWRAWPFRAAGIPSSEGGRSRNRRQPQEVSRDAPDHSLIAARRPERSKPRECAQEWGFRGESGTPNWALWTIHSGVPLMRQMTPHEVRRPIRTKFFFGSNFHSAGDMSPPRLAPPAPSPVGSRSFCGGEILL